MKKVIHLIAGLIKKISLYEISYLPELYSHTKNQIKIELNLSGYATNADLKSTTGIDKSKFTKKSDLVNKLDIDKLEIFPTNLSSLCNVI